MRVNDRDARFCDEYLVDMDARAAALRAGYPLKRADQAPDWLRPESGRCRPAIREAIAARMARRTGITAERVLREYARIAFSSLADIADLTSGVRPREDVSRECMAAVASVKYKQSGSGVDCEIKLYDKMKALDMLAKHVGLMVDDGIESDRMPGIVLFPDGSASIEGGDADAPSPDQRED